MANIIEIIEQNNRLDFVSTYTPIVCGNSNYVLKFTFSSAWQNANKKAAVFVVDGKRQVVDFDGNECKVPILPNAEFVFVSLVSGDGENQLITTPIRIRLERNFLGGDLSEFDQTASYLSKVLGAINSIENGKISVESSKTANNVSNPNLLINGDFKVNQRGQKQYTGMSGYTVDRWKNSGTYVDVNDDGAITVSHFGGWNYCYQPVEDFKSLRGKTVTLSVKIKNITYTSGKPVISINDGVSSTNSAQIFEAGTYFVTKTISPDATKLDCRLLLNNTAMASGEISDIVATIEWAKLEVGETPTNFVPRLYAEELALCQRYYQVIKKESGMTSLNMAFARSATALRILFQLTQTLRCVPTVKNENCVAYDIVSGGLITVADNEVTLTCFSNNQCVLNYATTNLVGGKFYFISDTNGKAQIELDAEIY